MGRILALTIFLLSGITSGQPSWPDSLNTAKNADYLSAQERAVIFEMNKARSNPKRYALEVILPMKKRFTVSGNSRMYYNADSMRILTQEGTAAIDECVKEMMGIAPMGLLAPSKGMSLAARDHVKDQGKTGSVGHTGTDGSSPWDRMGRYGQWLTTCGENIDYGNRDAQAIVVSLLVDDGVPSRGHRRSILNRTLKVVGVAIGSHPKYGTMCTLDFAGGYEEKK
ncbi:CAP domain-containing protein [uncultured Acetobacteroides sp.]|uniref:CAP domain-containing protein n=1 Tax=uncultured Acetobacteroides sp. TaxID=1760811 RepID=UPI0029F48DCD|nr:CAP domain-containing protein [uncultured Acetobacteroides sp.]